MNTNLLNLEAFVRHTMSTAQLNKMTINKTVSFIISGFAGTGKTTEGAAIHPVTDGMFYVPVDMESSIYRADHPEADWFKGYIDHVLELANNPSGILTERNVANDNGIALAFMLSAHEGVKDVLKEKGIPFLNVVPSVESYRRILKNLHKRYAADPSGKNERAYNWMRDNFEDIADIAVKAADCISEQIKARNYLGMEYYYILDIQDSEYMDSVNQYIIETMIRVVD